MSDQESHYRWAGTDLILKIRLTPRSSSDKVLGLMADRLKISITAPPIDGKANAHLIRFLAKQFGVAKARVVIIRGETTRDKTLCISEPTTTPDVFRIT